MVSITLLSSKLSGDIYLGYEQLKKIADEAVGKYVHQSDGSMRGVIVEAHVSPLVTEALTNGEFKHTPMSVVADIRLFKEE